MNDRQNPRVGVFICGCGGEISSVLDTKALREYAAELPDVVFASTESYPCSKDGQARMQSAIHEHQLERVLVAGCTPRLVRRLFEDTLITAGLDRNFLDVRDIREQCAYVHAKDPKAALQKAYDLLAMGVEHLSATSATHTHEGRVFKKALVIGSELAGLTTALALAEQGIDVVLMEQTDALGGETGALLDQGREKLARNVESVQQHARIETRLHTRLLEVVGQPGEYQVTLDKEGEQDRLTVGAIVVAGGGKFRSLEGERWVDRERVKTLAEYQAELDAAAESKNGFKPQDVVMLLHAADSLEERSLRLNSTLGLKQALHTKKLFPEANVTVLFRDLPLGAEGIDTLMAAREQGVIFFRSHEGHPPTVGEESVDVPDPLTCDSVSIAYDRAVLAMPLVPQENVDAVARMLRLPQDEHGFIVEPRVRLRPGNFVDDGVYVLGSAHQPADLSETLFQAYMTGSRVQRFLDQDSVDIQTPIAVVDAELCTGCGNCVQVCPRLAIRLEEREGVLSLAQVNALRCIGCGNCAVFCPVKAISLPGWDDAAILAQVSAALAPSPKRGKAQQEPRVLALTCEWSAYAAADMSGVQKIEYPAGVRIIPMNCSARFDPDLVLWAFLHGADGVYLGLCHPGDCHYGTGNLYASERVEVLKQQLAEHGFNPDRLHLEYLDGDDGEKFASTITEFVAEMKRLGG
ncbi:MAG TPA: hydrogenase iron-sulfur subunit [Anaerolineae bacterium]|nr:hydrogenase iron-sulfur subunit [Anaerolineae bacterium]